MYSTFTTAISNQSKEELGNKLLSKLIFQNKWLTKDQRRLLNTLPPDYILAYYAALNEVSAYNQARNTIPWIRRAYNFLKQELKGWTRLKHNWTDDYNATIIHVRKELELGQDEMLYEQQISPEYKADLEYIEREIQICEGQIKSIQYLIVLLNKQLDRCCELIGHIMPFEEFCSLIGINVVTGLNNLQDEIESTSNKELPYYYSLLWHGIEDAREEPDWKSNRNGMPYFDLCMDAFLIQLENNKEMKQKVDDYLIYEMGLGGAMYKMNINQNGETSFEKYYPPLKVMR